jgi:hypothetical protein
LGLDEDQTGYYPEGSTSGDALGVWCDFTFEELPTLSPEIMAIVADSLFPINVYKEVDGELAICTIDEINQLKAMT